MLKVDTKKETQFLWQELYPFPELWSWRSTERLNLLKSE